MLGGVCSRPFYFKVLVVEIQKEVCMNEDNYEVVASLELLPAMELEAQLIKMPSGEEVIRFVDCTGQPPIVYKWCLPMVDNWLKRRVGVKKG